MHENITSAGFVVYNNEVIVGVGATSDEAWGDFVREMGPGVTIVAEGEEPPDDGRNWVRERDYKIRAATQALIDQVARQGGNVAWGIARGICCTMDELEG
jgi:hypothetical protein